MTGYIPRWFTRPQAVIHPSTNPACSARPEVELTTYWIDHKSDDLTIALPSHRVTVAAEEDADDDDDDDDDDDEGFHKV